VVEDERSLVHLLTTALQDHYRLTHVSRLTDAIAALEHEAYVGVLLDLNLPDSQGLDTIQRLQEHCGAIPVVAWTGMLGMPRHGPGYVVCDKTGLDWAHLPRQLQALFRQVQQGGRSSG
jgi:DNA-binding NtrC family response regulator